MTTDDLISRLSQQPPRESKFQPHSVVLAAVAVSLLLTLLLSVFWLEPRGDLGPLVFGDPIFVLKIAFSLCVMILACRVVCDLSIPGRRVGGRSLLIFSLFALAISLAFCPPALQQLATLRSDYSHPTFECLWQIPALALLPLLVLFSVVRRLGPTDLNRTGAYIGLLAGSIGTLGYALHCYHDSITFIGLAYSLAMLETVLLGAIVGPRLLRWT